MKQLSPTKSKRRQTVVPSELEKRFENLTREEICSIVENGEVSMNQLVEAFHDEVTNYKKQESKNPMLAEVQKELKKKHDDFKKNQLKMGKTQPIDFNKEIFQVLSGRANEIQWYSFEQKIREIISEQSHPIEVAQKDIRVKLHTNTTDLASVSKRIYEVEYLMQTVKRQAQMFEELKQKQHKFMEETNGKYMSIKNAQFINIQRINDQQSTVESNSRKLKDCKDQISELRQFFNSVIKDSQDMNNTSQEFAIGIKRECMELLQNFQHKIEEVEKVKQKMKRMQDNIFDSIESVDKKHQEFQEKNHMRIAEVEKIVDDMKEYNDNTTVPLINNVEFIKKQVNLVDQNFQAVSFYLNRIQPLREFSIISNLMHSVINDKDQINKLVEYEHKFYESMKAKITSLILKLTKPQRESLSIKIPDKPCLQQCRSFIIKEKPKMTIIDQYQQAIKEIEIDELQGKSKRLIQERQNQISKIKESLKAMKKHEQECKCHDNVELKDKVVFNHFEVINIQLNQNRPRMQIIVELYEDIAQIISNNVAMSSQAIQVKDIEKVIRKHEKKQKQREMQIKLVESLGPLKKKKTMINKHSSPMAKKLESRQKSEMIPLKKPLSTSKEAPKPILGKGLFKGGKPIKTKDIKQSKQSNIIQITTPNSRPIEAFKYNGTDLIDAKPLATPKAELIEANQFQDAVNEVKPIEIKQVQAPILQYNQPSRDYVDNSNQASPSIFEKPDHSSKQSSFQADPSLVDPSSKLSSIIVNEEQPEQPEQLQDDQPSDDQLSEAYDQVGTTTNSDDYSEDSAINEDKLEYALQVFKAELLKEIEGTTREIAVRVAGETKNEVLNYIKEVKKNIIPQLMEEVKESKENAERQSQKLNDQVDVFHKDLKEAFVLIDAAHNKALRERTNILKEFQVVLDKINNLYNKTDDLKAKFTKLSLMAEQTFLQEQIKFLLDQQDENDRQNIALYGADDEPQNIVQLDQNCQACNGSINFTKKAFKMACLKYEPSPLLINGTVQTRKQLLEKREEIIDHQKEMLQQLLKRAPYVSPNRHIITNRVIDDCDNSLDTNNISNRMRSFVTTQQQTKRSTVPFVLSITPRRQPVSPFHFTARKSSQADIAEAVHSLKALQKSQKAQMRSRTSMGAIEPLQRMGSAGVPIDEEKYYLPNLGEPKAITNALQVRKKRIGGRV